MDTLDIVLVDLLMALGTGLGLIELVDRGLGITRWFQVMVPVAATAGGCVVHPFRNRLCMDTLLIGLVWTRDENPVLFCQLFIRMALGTSFC